jgi:hypothetical protein
VLRPLALGLLVGSLFSGALFSSTNLSLEGALALLLTVGAVSNFAASFSQDGICNSRGLSIRQSSGYAMVSRLSPYLH